MKIKKLRSLIRFKKYTDILLSSVVIIVFIISFFDQSKYIGILGTNIFLISMIFTGFFNAAHPGRVLKDKGFLKSDKKVFQKKSFWKFLLETGMVLFGIFGIVQVSRISFELGSLLSFIIFFFACGVSIVCGYFLRRKILPSFS